MLFIYGIHVVPGGPAIPGHSSGHGNDRVESVKVNPQQRPGYHNQRHLALATYNCRTLRTDAHISEELSWLRWGFIGLSKVRKEWEDMITLKSGNLLYFREGDHQSQGGVVFTVHKSLVSNVVKIESVSTTVACLVLRMTQRSTFL